MDFRHLRKTNNKNGMVHSRNFILNIDKRQIIIKEGSFVKCKTYFKRKVYKTRTEVLVTNRYSNVKQQISGMRSIKRREIEEKRETGEET